MTSYHIYLLSTVAVNGVKFTALAVYREMAL